MNTYTAADGNTYKTVTASGVSRTLANNNFQRLAEMFGFGFAVYTDEQGAVVVDHYTNPDFESSFFNELDALGYGYTVEANHVSDYRGKPIRVEAARITTRKVGA